MGVKLLVSALPNMGKTTLLKSLEEVIIISRDGKKYPFPQPHRNIISFGLGDMPPAADLILQIKQTLKAFRDKNNGKRAKTVVFDSISKILLDIEGLILQKISSFPYGIINTEIKQIMNYIENLTQNYNIILVSHALYDEETLGYKLVNAGGSWGKKGGVISEVDQAIFIEIVGSNRIIHFKNPLYLARSLSVDVPPTMPVKDFNLQEHLNNLNNLKQISDQWSL